MSNNLTEKEQARWMDVAVYEFSNLPNEEAAAKFIVNKMDTLLSNIEQHVGGTEDFQRFVYLVLVNCYRKGYNQGVHDALDMVGLEV